MCLLDTFAFPPNLHQERAQKEYWRRLEAPRSGERVDEAISVDQLTFDRLCAQQSQEVAQLGVLA